MEIGKKLAKVRKEKNIPQQTIADLLGVTKAMISRYENGKAEPTIANIQKMCTFYEIDIKSLFDEDMAIVNLNENKDNLLFDALVNGLIYEGLLKEDSIENLNSDTKERLLSAINRCLKSVK